MELGDTSAEEASPERPKKRELSKSARIQMVTMHMVEKNIKLNLYEYIAVYVDDLWIAAQHPKDTINILKSKYNLKFIGDGPLTYHLGADYFQDPDGTMVSQPKKYH